MKIVIFAFSLAVAVPAGWAQKTPKHPNGVAPDGSAYHQVKLGIRSFHSHPRLAPAQTTLPAPGVAQCYVDPNGVLSASFINTSTLPTGTSITGSITLLDDGSSIDFTGETLSGALPAGSFVQLPTITNFGELWYSSGAALDIGVMIQIPHGITSEVDCVALVGEAFQNSDLTSSEPLISAASTSVASSKDLILNLNGYFTSDTALVVLTDFYNSYVVPPSAVSLSGGQISVDLSQIAGLNLAYSDTLFVTVSQDGYSDTLEYRYLPGAPGTFNSAPQ
jgi:hypothetical protein